MSIVFNSAGVTLSLSWLFIGIFVAGWALLAWWRSPLPPMEDQ